MKEKKNTKNPFIIIKDDSNLPKTQYCDDHQIYLCVTAAGKTVVCKYTNFLGWESASNWRDLPSPVVAYQPIALPQEVLDLCTGKHVEYFDSLSADKETEHER